MLVCPELLWDGSIARGGRLGALQQRRLTIQPSLRALVQGVQLPRRSRERLQPPVPRSTPKQLSNIPYIQEQRRSSQHMGDTSTQPTPHARNCAAHRGQQHERGNTCCTKTTHAATQASSTAAHSSGRRGRKKEEEVITTQFPRRLIKEKAEVRQSQGSVSPFPHRKARADLQACILLALPLERHRAGQASSACRTSECIAQHIP
jgi:hypothetical protein